MLIDFGFGLPWGADRAIFGCHGWHAMLDVVGGLYRRHGTARATAEAINADARFGGHGPYRFNAGRTDHRFYNDQGVAYYRLVEVAIPQAISQWYLGSGGTVGFHTITGLAALSDLMARRDARELAFAVWPQEGLEPPADGHLVVESYPAVCPPVAADGRWEDEHQRDAVRVLDWVLRAAATATLGSAFTVRPRPFGRVDGVGFEEQVRFEGWILGVL